MWRMVHEQQAGFGDVIEALQSAPEALGAAFAVAFAAEEAAQGGNATGSLA